MICRLFLSLSLSELQQFYEIFAVENWASQRNYQILFLFSFQFHFVSFVFVVSFHFLRELVVSSRQKDAFNHDDYKIDPLTMQH